MKGIVHSAIDGDDFSTSRFARFITGNVTHYPLNRGVARPQSLSGHFGEEKNLLPLSNIICGVLQVVAVRRNSLHYLTTLFFFILFILVINQLDAQNLFYNKFISCLYMFRAPYAHRQGVKIVLYSLWYHHNYRWPSRARVVLETCRCMK